jgi:membrane fusion protein, adhesin transport system
MSQFSDKQPPEQQAAESAPATAPKKGALLGTQSLYNKFFERWAGDEEEETLDWQVEANSALVHQEPIRARALLYVVGIALILLIIWAAFADVDEVTRGDGKVIPTRQVQIIQSLDGGVVTSIDVKEGDVVEAGQLLVRLDATRFTSSLRENEVEYLVLKVKAARLKAVSEGVPFAPEAQWMEKIPDVVAQQQILYDAGISQLGSVKNIAEQQLEQRYQELAEVKAKSTQSAESYRLSAQELKKTRPLLASGAVSEVEILRLERDVVRFRGERDQSTAQAKRIDAAIAEAKGNINEVVLGYKNTIREELTEVTTRIKGLYESSIGLSDQVAQTAVRSPVHGTVSRLFFNTIGGVVLPGKEVIEIVPLDEALLLEARIKPRDIAFLTLGQPAVVKFTAYDFAIYGGLEASVAHIGADTVMDEDGNPFYTVRVRTVKSSLGEDKPIIPGMVAQVDILTGKKSILSYLLKPVLRAKEYALTER